MRRFLKWNLFRRHQELSNQRMCQESGGFKQTHKQECVTSGRPNNVPQLDTSWTMALYLGVCVYLAWTRDTPKNMCLSKCSQNNGKIQLHSTIFCVHQVMKMVIDPLFLVNLLSWSHALIIKYQGCGSNFPLTMGKLNVTRILQHHRIYHRAQALNSAILIQPVILPK